MIGRLLPFAALGVLIIVAGIPIASGLGLNLGFNLGSEKVQVSKDPGKNLASPEGEPRTLEIITVLGYDAIPAILDPRFFTPSEAADQMQPNEQVLGLSINDDSRAYSIRMLSRHEIVNDVVGGVPVAVTW